MRAVRTKTESSSLLGQTVAEQLGRRCELTMESFSVVVNLDRISPLFEDQGSKSGPTASSSFSLFFLPRSWKTQKHGCPALSTVGQAKTVGRERTPAEALWDMVGGSTAEAAANMERGSVPSSMELRGSVGAEDEEEDVEEVLPLRGPRRVFVSVTWAERQIMFCKTTRVWRKYCAVPVAT